MGVKAYRLSLVLIDFDDLGDSLLEELMAGQFGNDCIHISERSVKIEQVEDLGEWDDAHPLNQGGTDMHAWMKAHDPKCGAVISGKYKSNLGNTAETRRLRAMLDAVQNSDNVALGFVSTKATAEDGIGAVVCIPRGEDEKHAAAECAGIGFSAVQMWAAFFVDAAREGLTQRQFEELAECAGQAMADAFIAAKEQ